MDNYLWWRDGVIYQIYPRSFMDSNGDGLGDLPGIIARLDYLADLGVDAIWLSPIHPSPDKDFGYDVSDYCDVDPRYGCLDDFDRLVAEAHARGLRLIMDMVMNHTSDQHAWFKEARASRDNPKRDWYIWRDQPNNWQASFGGKAWEFDQASGQYYLHLFTKEQPDVNWRNPQVRQAQLGAFRFWMERGVDGFRLDVFNAYFKQAGLPDNPAQCGLRGFDRQRHIYDMDQPEMMALLYELRALLDSYPGRYSVGETYLATPQKTVSYCGPDKLHAAFSFDFTTANSVLAEAVQHYPWNPAWIMQQIARRELTFGAAGICSRYSKGEVDAQARIAMALLLSLRGTPFMYYGEEIGMRDIHLRRSEILDPPGRKYWPIYSGRDGCRSPMQWDAGRNAGFSNGKPWLPVHPDHLQRNVAAQEADPGSLLHFTRKLLALRKTHPALRSGDYAALEARRGSLAYLRSTPEQSVLVAINFKGHPTGFTPPEGKWESLFSSEAEAKEPAENLAPYEVRLLIQDF
jgi:alpha-glucosidase